MTTPPVFDQLDLKRDIRGAGFQWKVVLPKFENWNKRKEYFEQQKTKHITKNVHKKISQKENCIFCNFVDMGGYLRVFVKSWKVWLCKDTFIFYSPKGTNFMGVWGKESKAIAYGEFSKRLTFLNNSLRLGYEVSNKYKINLPRSDYGLIDCDLAKLLNSRLKKNFYVYDENKNCIYWTDQSPDSKGKPYNEIESGDDESIDLLKLDLLQMNKLKSTSFNYTDKKYNEAFIPLNEKLDSNSRGIATLLKQSEGQINNVRVEVFPNLDYIG